MSAALAIANLVSVLPDNAAAVAAVLIAVPGIGLFLCATLDRLFHNALSVLNAERRQKAREVGWKARLFRWGLPSGDGLLFAVALILIVTVLVVGHKPQAAALAFAGFWLVTVGQIALMVRGYPDDRFVPYF